MMGWFSANSRIKAKLLDGGWIALGVRIIEIQKIQNFIKIDFIQ